MRGPQQKTRDENPRNVEVEFSPRNIVSRGIFKVVNEGIQTMATSTLRSTKAITDYVVLTDELAAIATRQKDIERELKLLQAEVLDQIGERRSVMVNKQVRVLSPRIVESIKRVVDDETAVEYCRQHGLKFQERTPVYVAPATFSVHVKAGLLPAEFYDIVETLQISVL